MVIISVGNNKTHIIPFLNHAHKMNVSEKTRIVLKQKKDILIKKYFNS